MATTNHVFPLNTRNILLALLSVLCSYWVELTKIEKILSKFAAIADIILVSTFKFDWVEPANQLLNLTVSTSWKIIKKRLINIFKKSIEPSHKKTWVKKTLGK